MPDHKTAQGGKELRGTYDLDNTLVGFRATFCLVRESVSSIAPLDEGLETGWRKEGGPGGQTSDRWISGSLIASPATRASITLGLQQISGRDGNNELSVCPADG